MNQTHACIENSADAEAFERFSLKQFTFAKLTDAYQGVRNVRFSENLACFVFLKHPF